jgi:hypothetical protein
MMRQLLASILAALLLVGPLAPAATLRAEEAERMSFAEQTPPVKGPAQAQAREASIKARELPVTNRGALTTSIDIDVPPGRNGMTPRLALAYNSGAFRQESAFGVGWSLDVGAIRRSTANGFPPVEGRQVRRRWTARFRGARWTSHRDRLWCAPC